MQMWLVSRWSTALIAFLISLFLFIASSAWATTFDAGVGGNSSSGATLTVSHTITASGSNHFVIVGVTIDDSTRTVSSVTWNTSESLTQVPSARTTEAGISVDMWYLINPTTGTHDMDLEISSGDGKVMGIQSFTDVHQTTPLGTVATASSTTGNATVTANCNTGDVVVDAVGDHTTSSVLTVDASQTEDYNEDSTLHDGAGSHEAGAATVTMDWTVSTGRWVIAAICVQSPASAARRPIAPMIFQ